MTIDIEKLAIEAGFGEALLTWPNVPEKLLALCEAYAAKVLEDKERETAELKSHIEELRKFIYWECDVYLNGQNSEFSKKYRELLDKTPAQSLQSFENEVIERCAKVCDRFDNYGLADKIRALKGKTK